MENIFETLWDELEEQQTAEHIELTKVQADLALVALGKLEAQGDEVNNMADDEIELVEQYRKSELERIEKKRSWILFNLEPFMRQHFVATEQKSLRLPHGSMSLRKGRDRFEIQDLDAFLSVATKLGLLRTTPEEHQPDLVALAAYVKRTGEIPPGIKHIPATTNFNYSTKINGDSNHES